MRKTTPARGYALLIVLMVLALIALGFSTVLFVIESNLTETRRILGETRCFYANDSASRIASATVEAVAVQLPPGYPTDQAEADATQAVCDIAGGCTNGLPTGIMPPGVTMTRFQVRVVPTTGFRVIQSGPFRNVVVRDSGMSVEMEGRDDGTGRVCHVLDTFFTGTMSAFQFSMFGAGDANFYLRNNFSSPVPVYASGDLCIGGFSGKTFQMTNVGAGDDLHTPAGGTRRHRRHRRRTRPPITCPPPSPGGGQAIVAGVAYNQPDYVNSFDQANVLQLPVTTVPDMQGDNGTDLLSVHWLIDPVTSNDNQAVEALKMAEAADIRIIDGVWFLRDGAAPWPGTAVWSDHAGHNVQASAELQELIGNRLIGSDDIHDALVAAGKIASGAPWPPRRYSWYETDSGGLLDGKLPSGGRENVGVVSYGTVAFDSGRGLYVPAAWSSPIAGVDECGTAGGFTPWDSCGGADGKRAAILDATRSGFQDYNAANRATAKPQERNVLPVNIDVVALKAALADTQAGELGSYFQAGGMVGRPFTGAIWVSSVWGNQLIGLGEAPTGITGSLNPAQGVRVQNAGPDNDGDGDHDTYDQAIDVGSGPSGGGAGGGGGAAWPPPGVDLFTQIPNPATSLLPASATRSNFFLPHELCGETHGAPLGGGFQGLMCTPSTPADFEQYAYGKNGMGGPRATAVRVMNGGDLRAFQSAAANGSTGLTVGTNLPLYVYGDWNAAGPGLGGVFPRSMLAGDALTVLSPGWSDENASFIEPMTGAYSPPSASSHVVADDGGGSVSVGVMVRAGLMFGRTPSSQRPANQDTQSLVRVLEAFGGAAPLTVRGALLEGYWSVFRDDRQETNASLPAPTWDFRYDVSLFSPTLQPKGAPRFLAGVSGKWKDSR